MRDPITLGKAAVLAGIFGQRPTVADILIRPSGLHVFSQVPGLKTLPIKPLTSYTLSTHASFMPVEAAPAPPFDALERQRSVGHITPVQKASSVSSRASTVSSLQHRSTSAFRPVPVRGRASGTQGPGLSKQSSTSSLYGFDLP